jgi:hypothetical protein
VGKHEGDGRQEAEPRPIAPGPVDHRRTVREAAGERSRHRRTYALMAVTAK